MMSQVSALSAGGRALVETSRVIDERMVRNLGSSLPPTWPALYHYTTIAGAQGILRSGVFWAAHFSDGGLNDQGEVTYARGLTERLFDGELRAVSGWKTTEADHRLLRNQRKVRAWLLHSAIRGIPAVRDEAPAVVSLSQDGAENVLWERYAGGNAGCVIELDGRSFVGPQPHGGGRPYKIFPVWYREHDQRRLMREILKAVEERLWAHGDLHGPPALAERALREAALTLAFYFWAYAAFCKCRITWKVEREWRLMSLASEAHFEARPCGRRKVDLHIPPSGIAAVHLGSRVSEEAAEELAKCAVGRHMASTFSILRQ